MFAVTSFAEVWIEIDILTFFFWRVIVTSFAEVWIEIDFRQEVAAYGQGHFLRGSVD